MTLMDKKFGAEIVTKKGKVYKFDDVNCMLSFYNTGAEPEENILHRLIVDFSNPEKLIDAQQAVYVKSDGIKSPMASSIAAFERKSDMDQYNKEWKGIVLSWGELVTEFK
jgi:copper chaperone NosL